MILFLPCRGTVDISLLGSAVTDFLKSNCEIHFDTD